MDERMTFDCLTRLASVEEQCLAINERMTFGQLYRQSDPKRAIRSLNVHGPPLKIDAYENSTYYVFNFKSTPSTTGLRHKGYIKFRRPTRRNTPLSQVDCTVDCDCQDFRYRWAHANKQHGASKIGHNSLNQCINRPPRITNPEGRPGMCKHLLALKKYIDGILYSEMRNGRADTADAMKKAVKFAQERFPREREAMHQARERDASFRASRILRSAGVQSPEHPEAADVTVENPADIQPPSIVGAGDNTNVRNVRNRRNNEPAPEEPGPTEDDNQNQPGENREEGVVNMDLNKKNMKSLNEEFEGLGNGVGNVDQLEQAETEAQTPDQEALGLLRDIRDQLTQLNAAVAPEEEVPEEEPEEVPDADDGADLNPRDDEEVAVRGGDDDEKE
jgi:hypothetical protein